MNRAETITAIKNALDEGSTCNALSLAERCEAMFPDVAARAFAAIARIDAERAERQAEQARAILAEARKVTAPAGLPLIEGYFTVSDAQGHLTFKVERQEDTAKFAPGELIVSRLVGANNESDYKGVAFAKTDGRINVWTKFRGDARLVEALRILAQDPKAAGLGFAKASKRCYICNRMLTTPESILEGVGPVCREKGY